MTDAADASDRELERTSSYTLILRSDFQHAERRRSTGEELSGDDRKSTDNVSITSTICCREDKYLVMTRPPSAWTDSPLYP
jgi:hypothetical protein